MIGPYDVDGVPVTIHEGKPVRLEIAGRPMGTYDRPTDAAQAAPKLIAEAKRRLREKGVDI